MRRLALTLSVVSCAQLPDGVVFKCDPGGACPPTLVCRRFDTGDYCVEAGAGGGASGGGASGGSASGGSSGGAVGGGPSGGTSGGASGGSAGGASHAGGTAGGSAGGSVQGGGTGGGVAGGGAMDAGGVVAGCNPLESVSTSGLFVSPNGNDGLAGTPTLPLQSIGAALARVRTGAPIHLAPGVYAGNVVVLDDATLLGGWKVANGAWQRDCSVLGRTQTVVLALDAGPGLSIIDAGVTVRSLTIQTLLGGAPRADSSGASRIGVFALNATVRLSDVEVLATDAVSGGVAPGGLDATPSAVCIGPCSDGGSATTAPPARASDGGTFSAVGYVPGDGVLGRSGNAGQHGLPGTTGTMASNCYVGCGCGVNCQSSAPMGLIGPSGFCGCGGRGGTGGGQGRGGGASLGVFASSSSLLVVDSALRAGRGGDGSMGGPGGSGSLGTDGGTGEDRKCQQKPCQVTTGSCSTPTNVACYHGTGPADEVFTWALAGAPGGTGGRGANGQQGGSAAGGPSIAVVLFGGSTLALNGSVVLSVSDGGLGAPGAPNGLSVPVHTPP